MRTPKIGFLPLYIKLYDDVGLAELHAQLESFYEELAKGFEEKGVEVVRVPLCCVKDEFKAAVEKFEAADVDCIVTWHAAYSPSLESIDVLAATKLPIVIMDTTIYYDGGPAVGGELINPNHGIHGVMDMTNLLMRRRLETVNMAESLKSVE